VLEHDRDRQVRKEELFFVLPKLKWPFLQTSSSRGSEARSPTPESFCELNPACFSPIVTFKCTWGLKLVLLNSLHELLSDVHCKWRMDHNYLDLIKCRNYQSGHSLYFQEIGWWMDHLLPKKLEGRSLEHHVISLPPFGMKILIPYVEEIGATLVRFCFTTKHGFSKRGWRSLRLEQGD
jgi:hypothetical protein